MDKDIPIRVSNTLDYTHPGTLIIPSLKLQPRVCEVTTLLLSTYENTAKTEIGFDGDKGTRGLVVLVGLRVAQVFMVRQRISQALDSAKITFSFANLNRETSLALVVDSTVMKQAAKIMHVTFVAQPVSKRWLIPSRHPVDVHVAAHTGAGWA
jgi:aspartokinase